MTESLHDHIREAVRVSRAAQGLPPHVEDPVVLALLVRALDEASVGERKVAS